MLALHWGDIHWNSKYIQVQRAFRNGRILLTNGESPVYVKEQLGHSSIQMTVDIYGHLIPSSNRQAVNALDENAPKRTPSAPTQNEKAATR